MFALSFTALASARNQQIKEIKQERNSNGSAAPKKPLVPAIARRGIVALAIMTLAVSSAQAKGFGGGAGLYRGPSSGGMHMNSGRQMQPVNRGMSAPSKFSQNNSQVFKSSNVQKSTTHFDGKGSNTGISKGDGNGAGLARHVDTSKKLETVKNPDPSKFMHNAKTPDAGKNGKLNKTAELGKSAGLNKKTGLEKSLGKTSGKSAGKSLGKGAHSSLAATKKVNGKLVDAIKAGKLDSLTNGPAGRKLGLADQYKLMGTGNIARKMNLADKLQKNGGWYKRTCGPIDPHYSEHCKGQFYCGPKWCPSHCWCPKWCGWIEWCSGSPMWFDPRPDFCEPVACDDCDVDPGVVADHDGNPDSWVDDNPPPAADGNQPPAATDGDQPPPNDNVAVDLEVVAIRFVDNGNAEKNIGPRYRVLIRNNGTQAVAHSFAVAIITDAAQEQSDPTPRAGKTVPGIDAGQVLSVDVRLPAEANAAIKGDDGHSVEKYPKLGAIVDANDEIEEFDKGQ